MFPHQPILLSTAYLPPIEYFAAIGSGHVAIEKHETYSKQSYRNRCYIYGANGVLPLNIPITKPAGNASLSCDVRISDAENWQKAHWRSIESAYRSSPFFLYYADDIEPFFSKQYTFLIDYNTELLLMLLEAIGLPNKVEFTTEYKKNTENTDYRSTLHPKKGTLFAAMHKPYYQVFDNKHGFAPNLSIIDLLFNIGPEAMTYISKPQ